MGNEDIKWWFGFWRGHLRARASPLAALPCFTAHPRRTWQQLATTRTCNYSWHFTGFLFEQCACSHLPGNSRLAMSVTSPSSLISQVTLISCSQSVNPQVRSIVIIHSFVQSFTFILLTLYLHYQHLQKWHASLPCL